MMNKHEQIWQQIIETTTQLEVLYCLLILQNLEFYKGKNNISEKSPIQRNNVVSSKARPKKHARNSDTEIIDKSSKFSQEIRSTPSKN